MAHGCPFCQAPEGMIEWDPVLRVWLCLVCARRWRILRVVFE